ncbi:unnamed protein product, partial [Timema podura]|nr:unnamed protein product [Timema podura]
MEKLRKCFLLCINNSHEPIFLPHNKDIIIGRGPKTKITEKRCSKNQLCLTANSTLGEVKVKQLGPNKSGINGLALIRNESHVVKHGDTLEILLGQYFHKVEFEQLPLQGIGDNSINLNEGGIKRSLDDTEVESKRKREHSPADETVSGNLLSGVCEPCVQDKWEEIDQGKLLVFTSKGVESREKV